MLNNLGGEFRAGLTYVVGDVLAVGARYAPAVFYPLFLSPAEYGIYAIATAISTVMGALVIFGLKGAAFKQSFDYDDAEARRSFYGSLWLFIALGGAALVLIVNFLWGRFFPNIFDGVPYDPYIRLALWAAYLNGFGIIIYEIYRAQSKAGHYVGFSIANAFTLVLLSLFFVANFQQPLLGAMTAPVVTGLIWALIYSLVLMPQMKLRFDWLKVKKALAYGLPLIPHQIGHWILNLSDRVILEARVPLADLGVYGFGYNLGNVEQVIANAGNSALMPNYGKAPKDAAKRAALPALFANYVAWTAAAALAISIFADELIAAFMPAGFLQAASIVPWVALGFFCVSLYYGPMNVITLMAGETRWVWLFTLIAGAVNIAANLLLVPLLGIQAAAVNTLLGYFTLFALVNWYSRRFAGPVYPWKRIVGICATLVLGILVDRWYAPSNIWLEVLFDLAILGAYVSICFPGLNRRVKKRSR